MRFGSPPSVQQAENNHKNNQKRKYLQKTNGELVELAGWSVGYYSMFIRARAKPLLDKIPKSQTKTGKNTNPGERNSKQNYKNVKNFENHSLGVRAGLVFIWASGVVMKE